MPAFQPISVFVLLIEEYEALNRLQHLSLIWQHPPVKTRVLKLCSIMTTPKTITCNLCDTQPLKKNNDFVGALGKEKIYHF